MVWYSNGPVLICPVQAKIDIVCLDVRHFWAGTKKVVHPGLSVFINANKNNAYCGLNNNHLNTGHPNTYKIWTSLCPVFEWSKSMNAAQVPLKTRWQP
jgi:hypothetical protein